MRVLPGASLVSAVPELLYSETELPRGVFSLEPLQCVALRVLQTVNSPAYSCLNSLRSGEKMRHIPGSARPLYKLVLPLVFTRIGASRLAPFAAGRRAFWCVLPPLDPL